MHRASCLFFHLGYARFCVKPPNRISILAVLLLWERISVSNIRFPHIIIIKTRSATWCVLVTARNFGLMCGINYVYVFVLCIWIFSRVEYFSPSANPLRSSTPLFFAMHGLVKYSQTEANLGRVRNVFAVGVLRRSNDCLVGFGNDVFFYTERLTSFVLSSRSKRQSTR